MAAACLLFLLGCLIPRATGRFYYATLNVTNGGATGEWGPREFCQEGYAGGVAIKLQASHGWFLLPGQDDTALNGVRLHCTHGGNITSSVGKWGQWSKIHRCPQGHLLSFQLQTEPLRWGTDNTAANNLRMKCQDKVVLEEPWDGWGAWGPWSPRCPKGGICGLQTRVQTPQGSKDDTALNDIVFFCCCC